MELQYYGGNCVRISTKKGNIVVDDTLESLGSKSITKPGDICLSTSTAEVPSEGTKILINEPGEYEVSDISIHGIAAQAHVDEPGTNNATIYKIIAGDIRIAIVGNIYPQLSSEQLEMLSTIDVLVIPVGGNGYTLDPTGALSLIKEIEPKIIIPTHYDDKSLKYPVPQQTLEDAIKGLSMEHQEPLEKLKLKAGEIAEVTQLVILERK